jgi:diketogulonate reductase-like aldo/keto reductase
MKGESLDMLQVHWQDYNDTGYLKVLGHLIDIKRERTQRLEAVGLVNFDSERLDEICSTFGTGDIVSNQVQARISTADCCS